MEFHNGTSKDSLIGSDVTVFIRGDSPNMSSCPKCKVILVNDRLLIDFIPRFNGKHTSPVPDDAMISQDNEGNHAVLVLETSPAARKLRELWNAQEIEIARRN